MNGIPKSNLSYAKIIIEDPVRRGMLYAGTENAIYVSFDDGEQWLPLQADLPHAPVSGIVVQEHFNDLVISTYGRGFFILDDLAPLQQMTPEVLASAVALLRAARRLSVPSDHRALHLVRRSHARARTRSTARASTTISRRRPRRRRRSRSPTRRGDVVRTLTGTNTAGINRVSWDLRDTPGAETRLLTSPMYASHIMVGPEGRVAPARRASRCSSHPAPTP